MRIFNWVHKKLHQNVTKDIDGVTKIEKKNKSEGTSEIEKNTKAILDQVGLVDALDNWFDGVLTIGTFGFDTLKFEQEYEEEKDGGNDDNVECESVDLDYVVIDGSIIKNVDQELDPLLISNENMFYDHHDEFEFDSSKPIEIHVVAATVEAKPEPLKKRTTLAELFLEDREDGNDDTWHYKKPKNPNLDEVKDYKGSGSKLSSKFSFAKKKKILSKSKSEKEGKDLRPIKKVHRMIKRMLKKKIHPDIDATKAFKKDETLHLLNIQDCMA